MALVAIVGRPNVGKSTLFNRILGKRQAIVEGTPGATRDRNYAVAVWQGREFTLVDTGGFDPDAQEGVFSLIRRQALMAIEEADLLIFLMDTLEGLTPGDEEVAGILRRTKKPVVVAANKVEGKGKSAEAMEFYRLGMEPIFPISAQHGNGVADLLDQVVRNLPEGAPAEEPPCDMKVAVVGRPNTGKSTLINRILGEERLLVSEVPGTTHDSVDTLVQRKGKRYLLVDTAGIRRRARIEKDLERYTVMRSIGSVERSDICLLLLDPMEGVVDQDIRIAGLVNDRGRGLVLGLNKWDLVAKDHKTFDQMVKDIREKIFFLPHAPMLSFSGLTGQRVERLFETFDAVHGELTRQVPTSRLNQVLTQAVEAVHPPLVRGKPIKFYYAAQVETRPPTIILFTNRPGEVPLNYGRYLEGKLREAFGFEGVPLRVRYRGREKEKK